MSGAYSDPGEGAENTRKGRALTDGDTFDMFDAWETTTAYMGQPEPSPSYVPLTFSGFRDSMSLGDAKELLRTLVDEGYECPCCSQFAKIYKRPIHSSLARDFIRCYRSVGAGVWFHLPSLPVVERGGDTCKLRYWDLIEEETEMRRADGGRAGYWRITPLGERWVLERATVPRYARIYDSRLLGLTGEPWSVRQALGDKFDYNEIMGSAR